MYLGKIVELAPTNEFLNNPKHPYTQALIASIPLPDPTRKKERKGIEGEVPSPVRPPSGCRFHPRCPVATKECGWEGRDLVSLLMEKEKITEETHPLSKHIGAVRAEGLTTFLEVRPGGKIEIVEDWVRSKTTVATGRSSMFEAVRAVRRKALKGAKATVAVGFDRVEEPPLRDLGGGHLVACVLFPGNTGGAGTS